MLLLFMRFSLVVIGLEGKGWMSVVAGLIKIDVGWSLRVGQHSRYCLFSDCLVDLGIPEYWVFVYLSMVL